MAASDEITCPMCGFKNPADLERCRSCGAKIEVLSANYSEEEEYARRYQQEDFEWKWALIGAALMAVMQAVVLGVLPLIIHAFDPDGLKGLMLSVPIYFVGGIALGVISPGKTFVEPAVGAMIAAVPTIAIISARTPDGIFEPTLLAYIVCVAMGIMMALFGAFVGERVQMGEAKRQPRSR